MSIKRKASRKGSLFAYIIIVQTVLVGVMTRLRLVDRKVLAAVFVAGYLDLRCLFVAVCSGFSEVFGSYGEVLSRAPAVGEAVSQSLLRRGIALSCGKLEHILCRDHVLCNTHAVAKTPAVGVLSVGVFLMSGFFIPLHSFGGILANAPAVE